MLCEKCNLKNATTKVKRMVNGEYSEHYLCDDCASGFSFSSLLSEIDNDFSTIESMFLNALPERSGATKCPKCGYTYSDIISTKRLGCSECFKTFENEIKETIINIHGDEKHIGSIPENFEKQEKIKEEKNKLEEELKLAISKEEYEKAAELRDKIKELEGI